MGGTAVRIPYAGVKFSILSVFHSDRYEEGWDVFGDLEELFERFVDEHPHVLELLGKN